MKIGIFDSGVGGLTVLKNLINELPNQHYIYIGDNKHNPYGEKTKEQLHSYSKKIIDYFICREVKTIVVACNTISSNILDNLEKEYPTIKFYGVVKPTVEEVINSDAKKVLILATTATIDSNFYEKSIKKVKKNIQIMNLKMPLLVPLIEKQSQNIEQELQNIEKYAKKVDTILLGCTHYEIIREQIIKMFSKKIISSSFEVVKTIKKDIFNNKKDALKIEIYTTGNVKEFIKVSNNIINKKVTKLNL